MSSVLAREQEARDRLPGEPGIWMLVGGDLLVFSLFFLTFTYYRALAPERFAEAKQALGLALGLFNTILLLSGSLLVARAVEEARHGAKARAARLMGLGALTGVAFLGDKAIEWTHLVTDGWTATAGDFGMLFFCLTGIHGVQVLVASIALFVLSRAMLAPDWRPPMAIIEACGIFWHVVDLLWIVLFALFYLAA